MQYHPSEIEAKWQKIWSENQTFKAENNSEKPKYYVLDMFPYPSGAGLHVGHPLGYIASDIYARYKRHKGFNVLHPMGYDSFGLPAEQYAIQTGQHPAKTTQENIKRYREQLDKIGFSFDWEREVRTSEPDYYRWTQWIFIQLYNSYYCNDSQKARPIDELIEAFEQDGNIKINAESSQEVKFGFDEWNAFSDKQKSDILLNYRLAYLAEAEVNWCAALGTVLANDEVVNGVSERGGYPVERKKMTQWMMRITAYSERLLNGITYNLSDLDWSEALKEGQKNWIGKSQGALVTFKIENSEDSFQVFTTRPDTIFGVSFMTLAPEHPLVQKITTPDKKSEVETYVQQTSLKSERERMADVKRVSGVFTGAYALHPISDKKIPIWIGDYVLSSYGTGAVMAVPAGDERDYAFAKYFNLEIPEIFEGIDLSQNAYADKDENIPLQNSDFLNGLNFKKAQNKVIEFLENNKKGERKINYRLRDAVFSRQRYWGEPVPMYFKNGIPTPISDEYLPLELPQIDEYLPTETGEPPLGRAKEWAWSELTNKVVSKEFIDQKSVFPLELNTMPGWAGSSWYFFRYMDPKNTNEFASENALNYWENVDLYIGGSEHATGHLLYARFWTKFLKDLGKVQVEEPFKKLINQGMILGESAFVFRDKERNEFVSYDLIDNPDEHIFQKLHADVSFIDESNQTLDIQAFKRWRPEYAQANFRTSESGKFHVVREVEKMSKSKYNVVNPDEICAEYGADTLRMYEMFLGPLEQYKPWNTNGLSGVFGFLKRFWKLYFNENDFFLSTEKPSAEEMKILHVLIKKVTEDIEEFSFNTSISAFMIAVNELQKLKCNKKEVLEPLCVLLSPFAPHITEELWSRMGNDKSISYADFPIFDEKYLVESEKTYPVSFNGKVRFTLNLSLDLTIDEIQEIVMNEERTQKQLQGREPKKVIIVPGKIINIVG